MIGLFIRLIGEGNGWLEDEVIIEEWVIFSRNVPKFY